jgi:hypothetical protein
MAKSKEVRIKCRRTWSMSPVTRICHSRKPYDRNRKKQEDIKLLESELIDEEEQEEDWDYTEE